MPGAIMVVNYKQNVSMQHSQTVKDRNIYFILCNVFKGPPKMEQNISG